MSYNFVYNLNNKLSVAKSTKSTKSTTKSTTKFTTKSTKYNIYNPSMNYYICSFGGCGSTILQKYLSNFGNVYHIHDRYPPQKLQYVGNVNSTQNVYKEWFNGVEIPENELCNYKVIYIYRNPLNAIHSRFFNNHGPNFTHLQNIKCINNGYIGLQDLNIQQQDLYQLNEFFHNYTDVNKNRNYKIYCVKYEQFWDNIYFFNKTIDIPDKIELYPIKNERKHNIYRYKFLYNIYKTLILKMVNNHFIELV